MVDRNDPGFGRVESTGFAGGVNGDMFACASGFFDGSGELGLGVLIWRGQLTVADRVGAGFVDLDEVGAFLELLANHSEELLSGIGIRGVRKHVLLGIETVGVFVTAENIDGITADAEAKTGDEAGVDGIANGGVRGTRAFSAHVAFGGKASEKIIARGHRRNDGALRNGLFDRLEILGSRMKEEVDVGVNEAGEKRDIAEIESLRGGRMFDRGANFDDAVAADQDFAGRKNFAGFDLEEA